MFPVIKKIKGVEIPETVLNSKLSVTKWIVHPDSFSSSWLFSSSQSLHKHCSASSEDCFLSITWSTSNQSSRILMFSSYYQNLAIIMNVLAFFNTTTSFIIYSTLSAKFRRLFTQIFFPKCVTEKLYRVSNCNLITINVIILEKEYGHGSCINSQCNSELLNFWSGTYTNNTLMGSDK